MEKLTTLKTVATQVNKLSAHCFDDTINVDDISFDNLNVIRIAGEEHALRPVAQRAVANRLGIPYFYLKRCPEDIQATNLNHWIQEERNDQLFIRFDGQDVRAVFTTKYKPVDNFEVMERLDSLGYRPETEVQCSLDPDFLSLSIPDGNKLFDINGDRFKPGISISNSEVGLASLSVGCFCIRLICSNGLISKTETSASFRHVSNRILDEFPDVLEKVSYELGAQRHQFKLSMESPVDDPMSTLTSFNRQFGLNADEKSAVDWGWSKEFGDRMFHIIQAYTRASQFESLPAESSHRLQKVGGNILAMVSSN